LSSSDRLYQVCGISAELREIRILSSGSFVMGVFKLTRRLVLYPDVIWLQSLLRT